MTVESYVDTYSFVVIYGGVGGSRMLLLLLLLAYRRRLLSPNMLVVRTEQSLRARKFGCLVCLFS